MEPSSEVQSRAVSYVGIPFSDIFVLLKFHYHYVSHHHRLLCCKSSQIDGLCRMDSVDRGDAGEWQDMGRQIDFAKTI
jgi:hypothetical protein